MYVSFMAESINVERTVSAVKMAHGTVEVPLFRKVFQIMTNE